MFCETQFSIKKMNAFDACHFEPYCYCVAINETMAMTEAQTDKERGNNITSMHD